MANRCISRRCLPLAPLRPFLQAAIGRYGGEKEFEEAFCARFGLRKNHGGYLASLYKKKQVTLESADRLAVACGYHPAEIWGEDWWGWEEDR